MLLVYSFNEFFNYYKMRLNKNTYPSYFTMQESIKKLDVHSDIIDFYSKNKDFDINYSIDVFNKAQKKYFITHSFSESIHKAEDKIIDFAEKRGMINFISDFKDESGIFFFDGGWILYEIKDKKHSIFWFNKNILLGSIFIINDNIYGCISKDKDISYFVRSFLTTLWFIRNCDVEQKIMKPKEKYRENGNKHYNESENELIILDCRWFTELIRDIPFLVKGHFRWQPVGEGRNQKKLIWIEDFKKEGYHRKATKELTNLV